MLLAIVSLKLFMRTQVFVNKLYFEIKKKDIDIKILLIMKNREIC